MPRLLLSTHKHTHSESRLLGVQCTQGDSRHKKAGISLHGIFQTLSASYKTSSAGPCHNLLSVSSTDFREQNVRSYHLDFLLLPPKH